jgi:hypothetical protein
MSNIIVQPKSGVIEFNTGAASGSAFFTPTAPIRLDATGGNSWLTGTNIGIGTNAPTAQYDRTLHVEGANPTIRLETSYSAGWAYNQYVSPETTWSVGIDNNDDFVIASSATLSSSRRLVINDNNGNIDVAGGLTASRFVTDGTEASLFGILNADSGSFASGVTISGNAVLTGSSNLGTLAFLSAIDADSVSVSNLETDNIKASTLVIESEGIGNNDNDTTIPTSAAVKAYVDAGGGGGGSVGTLQQVTTLGSTTSVNMEIQGAGSKSFTVDSTDGHASVVIDRHSTSYDANLSFQTNGATKWRLWNDSNDSTFSIRDEVNASNVMTWEVGGNVGIGTDDPDALLELSKDGAGSSTTLLNVGGTGNGRMLVRHIDGKLHSSDATHQLYLNYLSSDHISMVNGGGNVGIGSNTPSAKLDVAGGIKLLDNNYLAWNGSNTRMIGNSDYLQFQVAASDKVRITSAGNVGIGTNNPSRDLQIGDGSSDSVVSIVGPTAGLSQLALGDTDDDNYGQILVDHSANKLQIQNGGGGAIGNRGITLDSSENVGIGTNNPTGKLHIYNTASGSDGDGTATMNATGQDSIVLYGHGGVNTATYGSISWLAGDTNRRRAMITAVAESADTDFMGLAFYTQGTDGAGDFSESMRITRDGDLGLGTTSVNAGIGLQVANGSLYVTNGVANVNHIEAQYFGNGQELKLSAGQSADLKLMHYNTVDVTVKSDGKVGIGTITPSGVLDVGGDGATILLHSNDYKIASIHNRGTSTNYDRGGFSLYNQTVEALRLDSFGDSYFNGGNVGIGTNSCDKQVHISATEPYLRLEESDSGGNKRLDLFVSSSTGVIAANQSAQTMMFQTVGKNRMTITAAGNVGIGATNATSPFHLRTTAVSRADSTAVTVMTKAIATTTIGAKLSFTGINNSNNNIIGGLSMGNDGEEFAGMYAVDGGASATTHLAFFAGNATSTNEGIRLLSEGRVGIGTTNPDYTLTVDAGATNEIARFRSTDNDAMISVQDNTDAVYIGLDASADIMSLGFSNAFTTGNLSIDMEGNVGIGTTSMGAKLDIKSEPNTNVIFTRSATDGQLLHNFWVDSSDHAKLSMYANGQSQKIQLNTNGSSYFNGGSVGIGSASPAFVLDTVFAGDNGARIKSSDNHSTLTIQSHSSYGGYIRFTDGANRYWIHNDANDSLYFRPKAVAPATNIGVTFDETGRVGIGSYNPAYTLDVARADGGTLARFKDSDSSHAGLLIQGDTNGGSITNASAFSSEVIYLQNSANAMRFYTDGTEAVRIDSSQRVGIGTNSVNGFTHINGRMTVESPAVPSTLAISDSGDATKCLRMGFDTGWDAGSIQASDFGAGWKNIVMASYGGNVGIGTTSVPQKLTVKGGITATNSSNIQVVTMTNSSDDGRLIVNQAAGVTKVLLDSDGDSYFNGGDVGIGSATPAYKLDVAGDIQAKDSAFFAGNLGNLGYSFHDLGTGWGFKGLQSSSRLAVLVQGVESVTFENNGRVGIGVTEPSQQLEVKTNTDVSAQIGRAQVGYMGFADHAGFSHLDQAGTSSYSLLQSSVGDTFINSASNRQIYFRDGNATIGGFNSDDDFYVDTNTLYVDASQNTVGVGTATMHTGAKLTIQANNENVIATGLVINSYQSTTATAGNGVGIVMGQNNGVYSSKIANVWTNNNPSYLQTNIAFYTMHDSYLAGSETEKMRLSSRGRLGIGTTAPTQKLNISGGHILIDNQDPQIQFNDTDGSSYTASWMYQNNAIKFVWGGGHKFKVDSAGGMTLGQSYSSSETAPSKGIITEGRVGLGTTSPSATLHVADTTSETDGKVIISGTGTCTLASDLYVYGSGNSDVIHAVRDRNDASIKVTSTTAGAYFRTNSAASSFNGLDLNSNWFIGQYGVADLRIVDGTASAGDAAAAITVQNSTKYVGIGTTNPISALHVIGDGGDAVQVDNGYVRIRETSNNDAIQIQASVGNEARILASDFGTSSAHPLKIAADQIRFTTSGNAANTEVMRITAEGKVGIGTDDPTTARLRIKGTTNDNSTLALQCVDSTDTQTFFVRNDGVVQVTDNYFYVSSNAGAYVQNDLRVRGSLSNDGGALVVGGDVNFDVNTLFVDSTNNRVGIGTNSPAYQLDINTGGTMRINSGSANSTAIRVGGGNNDVTLMRVDSVGGTTDDSSYGFAVKYMGTRNGDANSLSIFADDQTSTQHEAVTIDQKGKVGIGSISPTQKLDIAGDTDVSAVIGKAHVGLVGSDTDVAGFAHVDSKLHTQAAVRQTANGQTKLGCASSQDITFFQNNNQIGGFNTSKDFFVDSDTLYVDVSEEKVGIGSNAPAETLDVVGLIRFAHTRANNTQKIARLLVPEYNNSHGQFLSFMGTANETSNAVSYGGGTSSADAATVLLFYTASSVNTTVGTERMRITHEGRVGIGTQSPGYELEVNGSIVGTSKSFLIEHPTQTGKKLMHACIEGPENGVYFRGRSQETGIQAPEYWSGLVDIDSMTVDVTPIGPNQSIYVDRIDDNGDICVGSNTNESLNYFYVVYGERKDIDKLEVVKDAAPPITGIAYNN